MAFEQQTLIDVPKTTILNGPFINQGGRHIAMVAIINTLGRKGFWSALAGTDAPNSTTKRETYKFVAKYGEPLDEQLARKIFPRIPYPYRNKRGFKL